MDGLKKRQRTIKHIVHGLEFIFFILAAFTLLKYYVLVPFYSTTTPTGTHTTTTATTTPYLHSEEAVLIATSTATIPHIIPVNQVMFEYVEVIDSCGPHFEDDCLVVRSGPGSDYEVVSRLRNGVVLKIDGQVERDGMQWYKIVFDEWLRYPNRVSSDWYVAADYVKILLDEGDKTTWEDGKASTTKRIIVDTSEQKLYAYDGDQRFMETSISTGLELTPTPRGTFAIYKKTPSRYMQGPLPGLADQQVYDLPGVPWNLYFTQGGAVIHGAYWHNSFGSPYSHGCVNMLPADAYTLYNWAELGVPVTIQN